MLTVPMTGPLLTLKNGGLEVPHVAFIPRLLTGRKYPPLPVPRFWACKTSIKLSAEFRSISVGAVTVIFRMPSIVPLRMEVKSITGEPRS